MTRVLVVDDSAVDRLIVGGILEARSMEVSFAANGQEALSQMAADRPDLVLTDLQMPVMDGLALVRKVNAQYPAVPVMLITREGSEDIAAEALRAGAASYIPKRNLKRDLGQVLQTVLSALQEIKERERVQDVLESAEGHFVLGFDKTAIQPLVNHLQDGLLQCGISSESVRLRIGTALVEALTNAIDHGNLELDSKLREDSLDAYHQLGVERAQQSPYRERRVHVTARYVPGEAQFSVRDEGPGFDPNDLPDPTDPENLIKPCGRGVMLIRTFMDEVRFNDSGNEITMIKRAGA